MAGGVSLQFTMCKDLPNGKDPGWWRQAHRDRLAKQIDEIVKKWHSDPNQSVWAGDYVRAQIRFKRIDLTDITQGELDGLINDALFLCAGLERVARVR